MQTADGGLTDGHDEANPENRHCVAFMTTPVCIVSVGKFREGN